MSSHSYQKEPAMNYGPKRIAAMIAANVLAMEAGIITWAQFGRVQRATWDLVHPGEVPNWRRARRVQLALRAKAA